MSSSGLDEIAERANPGRIVGTHFIFLIFQSKKIETSDQESKEIRLNRGRARAPKIMNYQRFAFLKQFILFIFLSTSFFGGMFFCFL